jgi:hypothetical protein
MKAIISREVDGKFPEVGTNDRMTTRAKQLKTIVKRARAFSRGRRCKVECFNDMEFYKKPFYTFQLNEKTED